MFVIVIFSCKPRVDEPGIEPEMFIDDFYSYQSLPDFKNQIKLVVDTIEVVEHVQLPEDNKKKFLDIYTLDVAGYTHLGERGKLRCSFYNGRLAEIAFYPEDKTAYLKKLRREMNIDLVNWKTARINNKSIYGWEEDSIFYVGWRDNRLEKEKNNWINKHSLEN